MKQFERILAVCAVFCGLMYPAAAPLRAAADSPDRQFDAISRLIEKADQTLESGKTQEAAQLYGATIAAYRDFSVRFPEYRTELVQFRVSYCRNQLMTLLAARQADTARTNALPDDIARRVDQGIDLCSEGRFTDAAAQMRDLIATHPSCAPAYLVLATAALGNGSPEEAKQLLERTIELDADGSASAHYNMSQLIMRESSPDYEKAKTHYLRARELGAVADPDLESVLDL